MVGFWFGIGVILAVGVADGLNYHAGCLQATNEIAAKMTSNGVTTTNVEVPLQVMTKDLKKVAAGKKFTEWNHKIQKSWPRKLKLSQMKLRKVNLR